MSKPNCYNKLCYVITKILRFRKVCPFFDRRNKVDKIVSTWVLVVSNAVTTSVVGAQVGVGVGVGVGGGSGSGSEEESGKGSGVKRGEGSPSEGCRSRFALA